MSRALLVIDIQNDFCYGGTLEVSGANEIIPVVNQYMQDFSTVVSTQDFHPPGHVSFASSHTGKRPFEKTIIDDTEETLWPDHCVIGTQGADFHPLLDTDCFEMIQRKGMKRNLDSYSAFFENDRKTPTGLKGWLQAKGIKEIFLCGLALDICVYYSALDGVSLGFKTTILGNACRSVSPGSLPSLKQCFAKARIHFDE